MEKIIIVEWIPHNIKEVNLWKLNKEDFNKAIKSTMYYNLENDEIIISKKEYLNLIYDKANLNALDWAWVDNWDWYWEVINIDEEELDKRVNNSIKNRRIMREC